MSKFWSKNVKQLNPYVPGEQPEQDTSLKLNTNENPYGPSPRVLAALKNGISDNLRLYPDPESVELKKTIANYHNIDTANIFVGNGSDEILAFIFQGFFKQNHPIVFPNITYSFYPVYCKLYEINFNVIPLKSNFEINLNDYLITNGGVIFPNPNAPTGIPKSKHEIENLLKNNNESIVVIDEAYVDFGTESSLSLIDKYENLIVTHSLSKSRSLAGMRIGCAFANQDIIQGLNRVKNSFNSYPIDRLAQIAAKEAFEDEEYFHQTVSKVIEAREFLINQISILGFESLPSGANFIFTKHKKVKAKLIYDELRKEDILIRHFDNPEVINDFLRITIGTYQQMEKLIKKLKSLQDLNV